MMNKKTKQLRGASKFLLATSIKMKKYNTELEKATDQYLLALMVAQDDTYFHQLRRKTIGRKMIQNLMDSGETKHSALHIINFVESNKAKILTDREHHNG